MGVRWRRGSGLLLTGIGCLLASRSFPAMATEPFPVVRPATRVQAVVALSGGTDLAVPCLSPMVQSLLDDPNEGTPSARRALGLLQGAAFLPGERRLVEPDGTTIRYTVQRNAFDHLDGSDEDGDGRPDILESVLDGLQDARRLLVGQIGLPAPDPLEVLLAKVGGNLEGYTVPSTGGRPLLVLDASPLGGASSARRSAVHQYAHAVSLITGSALPGDWAEALATWTVLRVEQGPDPATAALLSGRLDRMSEGLLTDVLELAAGNAAWLAFVEEAYGATALRLTIEELASGAPQPLALDRALRRAAGESLVSAFREWHLWTVLVGERSNGRHFSFADRLASPRFASSSDGVPVLSVQADPPVAPLGTASVLLQPGETEGGLAIRFEGETPGRWETEVLLVGDRGSLRRLRFPLSTKGKGEVTVPLDGLAEAVLLIRNLDADLRAARRYTWSAHSVREYPFEISSLQATSQPGGGVLVAWETRSEHDLVGYNVLRRQEGSPAVARINPIWVPALGDESTPTSYQFLDSTVLAGASYSYQIEAITGSGLPSYSDLVAPVLRTTSP